MAALASLYISPECSDEQGLPPLLYYSFFALLTVEIGTVIDETIIMSISYRGQIWDTHKRDTQLPKYLYIRLALLFLEFITVIVCSIATFNPDLISVLNCNSYHVAVALAQASSVIILVKCFGSVVRLCVFIDPCGLFTPGLLQHLSFLDTVDDVGETPTSFMRQRSDSWLKSFLHLNKPVPNPFHTTNSVRAGRIVTSDVNFWQHQMNISQTVRGGITPDELSRQVSQYHSDYIGLRRIERRLRVVFCCLGVGGHRSRGIALQDIARALYTLFDFKEEGEKEDVKLVLSDVIAGFKLVNYYQRNKITRLEKGERLEDKFRMVRINKLGS